MRNYSAFSGIETIKTIIYILKLIFFLFLNKVEILKQYSSIILSALFNSQTMPVGQHRQHSGAVHQYQYHF